MNIYIIILLTVIAIYILLYKTYYTKYSRLLFCITVFIFFSCIQGLRAPSVGNDTSNYLEFFKIAKNMSIMNVITSKYWVIEPGYGILMKLFNYIGISGQAFIFIIAIIINGGILYFIYKNSKDPFMSVIIIMGAEFFTLSFTALRQLIALTIVLNSYTFIVNKKYCKFILLILLAATFHKTALIFLPAYLLRYMKLNKNMIYIWGGCILISQIIGIPLLNYLIKKYYYNSYLINASQGGIIQALIILFYIIFGLIFRNRGKFNGNHILYNIIFVAFIIQLLACRINMVSRLMWYYYIFIIIYLPNIINCIKTKINIGINSHNYKLNLNIIIYFTIIGVNILQYVISSINMYNIIPYITIL